MLPLFILVIIYFKDLTISGDYFDSVKITFSEWCVLSSIFKLFSCCKRVLKVVLGTRILPFLACKCKFRVLLDYDK